MIQEQTAHRIHIQVAGNVFDQRIIPVSLLCQSIEQSVFKYTANLIISRSAAYFLPEIAEQNITVQYRFSEHQKITLDMLHQIFF